MRRVARKNSERSEKRMKDEMSRMENAEKKMRMVNSLVLPIVVLLLLVSVGYALTISATVDVFSVSKAPQWRNQGTNDTDNIILQGESINLTAQGKDETALDWAWLATNETGQWKNYTRLSSGTSSTVSDTFTDETRVAVKTNLTIASGQVKLNTAAGGDQTETLRPNAAGSSAYLSRSGCTSNYQCVDEVTSDVDSTYVYAASTSGGPHDTYNLDNHAGSGTIKSVTVYIVISKTSGTPYGRTKLLTHNTIYYGSTLSVPASYTTYSTTYTNNPYTGAAWTWDEIDALQAGVHFYGTGSAKCTQVYVIVNYVSSVSAYPSGELRSTNILVGQNVGSISSFGYSSTIPAGTSLQVQFSQDNSNWKNSTGSVNGWDTLTAGQKTISLSSLGWSGPNFYYKIRFTGGTNTPVLDDINLTYTLPSSSIYNSPMNMQDAADVWTWSNFTWQNSSIPQGTTVGWRIYYNDTSSNENVTNIMAFRIEVPPNTQPIVNNIIISPASPYTTDDLKCNATLIDGEQTSLTAYYTWYVNGVANVSGVKGVTNGANTLISTLSNVLTKKGDKWTCEVMPFDGILNGLAVNTSVTIKNSAPVLAPIGNKTVNVGQLLQFTINANDTDNDVLMYGAYNIPANSTFIGQTFSWIPNSTQSGVYPNIMFMTSDGTLVTLENITITVTGEARTYTITLNESNRGNIGDNHVVEVAPNTIAGNGAWGWVSVRSYSTGYRERAFTMWDLSVIPSGATITNANLSLFLYKGAPSSTRTFNVYNTSNSWTETSITWNNQPSASILQSGATIVAGQNNVWKYWNVTNAAIYQYSQSNQKLSIMIKDSAEGTAQAETQFGSKEYATVANRPQLVITYTLPV